MDLPIFSGTQQDQFDVYDFLDHLDCTATYLSWTERQTILALRLSVRGPARDFLRTLKDDTLNSLANLQKALEERFGPSISQLYDALFGCMFYEDQDIKEFCDYFQVIIVRLEKTGEHLSEDSKVSAFLRALDPALYSATCIRIPRTLEEAIGAACHYGGYRAGQWSKYADLPDDNYTTEGELHRRFVPTSSANYPNLDVSINAQLRELGWDMKPLNRKLAETSAFYSSTVELSHKQSIYEDDLTPLITDLNHSQLNVEASDTGNYPTMDSDSVLEDNDPVEETENTLAPLKILKPLYDANDPDMQSIDEDADEYESDQAYGLTGHPPETSDTSAKPTSVEHENDDDLRDIPQKALNGASAIVEGSNGKHFEDIPQRESFYDTNRAEHASGYEDKDQTLRRFVLSLYINVDYSLANPTIGGLDIEEIT